MVANRPLNRPDATQGLSATGVLGVSETYGRTAKSTCVGQIRAFRRQEWAKANPVRPGRLRQGSQFAAIPPRTQAYRVHRILAASGQGELGYESLEECYDAFVYREPYGLATLNVEIERLRLAADGKFDHDAILSHLVAFKSSNAAGLET